MLARRRCGVGVGEGVRGGVKETALPRKTSDVAKAGSAWPPTWPINTRSGAGLPPMPLTNHSQAKKSMHSGLEFDTTTPTLVPSTAPFRT